MTNATPYTAYGGAAERPRARTEDSNSTYSSNGPHPSPRQRNIQAPSPPIEFPSPTPVTTGPVHTPAVFDPHRNTAIPMRAVDDPFISHTEREIPLAADPFQPGPSGTRNRTSPTHPSPKQQQQNPFDSEDYELGFGRRLYPMSEISSLSSRLPSPVTSPRTREASDLLNDRVRRAYAQ